MKRTIILFTLLTASTLILTNQSVASGWEKSLYQEPAVNSNTEIFQRLYIGLNGGLNLAIFGNQNATKPEWQAGNVFNIIPSVDVTYLVTKNIGAGIGLRLGNFTSSYKIANLSTQLEREFVDIDQDTYFPIYENANLEENTTYTSLDIPLFVRYQNTINAGKLSYFANLGVVMSSFMSTDFNLSGTITRKGYYPDFNVVLNGYPEYKYDDLEYNENSSMELGAPKMMVSGYLSAGAMYSVTSDILVKVGISGTYGFTKVEPVIEDSFSDFHSSLILGSSSITSVGFEVGVVYKLFNK
ncbi:MAG: hypothetical protein PHT92_00875 [Bacteroidales bacterium]|nr:hypothetical protein [Bacteroidales bacterium]